MRGKESMLELVRLYTIQEVLISYREGERLSSQCESLYLLLDEEQGELQLSHI